MWMKIKFALSLAILSGAMAFAILVLKHEVARDLARIDPETFSTRCECGDDCLLQKCGLYAE
jgi:hypothetical protein